MNIYNFAIVCGRELAAVQSGYVESSSPCVDLESSQPAAFLF